MISYQNIEIFASVFIYLVTKFLCIIVEKHQVSMYNKQPTLTSIPERDESDDDIVKWVPKKKHEVLKAKYKCLKKLFQIYDASVIGILPQTELVPKEEPKIHRRRRSRRTKTDACAGTSEVSSGDVSERDTDRSIAATVIKDLNLVTSQKEQTKDDKSTQDSKEDLSVASEKSDYENIPIHYLKEGRRPTRFQMFLQRILGIKRDRTYGYTLPNDRIYPSSDNNISNRYEKRRRRGLRFSRIRRPKKIHSEIDLGDMKSPVILSYVQSAQKNCLMDTTPRHCPIVGCKMISYGIINYNDHLNLCHFPDRKYICHYCHEGFSREYDKTVHENEHLGITKISANFASIPSTTRLSTKMEIDTQTDPDLSKLDVPEEKLKKIVSFFDKISNPDQIVANVKKNRYSESNLQTLHRNTKTDTESQISSQFESNKSSDSGNKTYSSVALQRKCESKMTSSGSKDSSKYPPVRCQLCGEGFDYRRQLSLHIDLEHRTNDKFSKFHSCAGIVNHASDKINNSNTKSETEVSRTNSNNTLTYDPSTNIVYYTSTESINNTSSNSMEKNRSGFLYKWEPGTKIIRV